MATRLLGRWRDLSIWVLCFGMQNLRVAALALAVLASSHAAQASSMMNTMLRNGMRRGAGLPRPEYSVDETIGVMVHASDGISLASDLYLPGVEEAVPAILIRTPYGRASQRAVAQILAGEGYAVLAQDCRGTGDSGGKYTPGVNERRDGVEAASWIEQQPWFDGDLFLYGASYRSYAAWATAVELPEKPRAILPISTMTSFYDVMYGKGVAAIGIPVTWTFISEHIRNGVPPLGDLIRMMKELESIPFDQRPLVVLDQAALGRSVDYYQSFVGGTDPGHPIWDSTISADDIGRVAAPAHLIGGWHDFCLLSTLDAYHALAEAGREPFLTLGPYAHASTGLTHQALSNAVVWFAAHRSDGGSGVADMEHAPVRYWVLGADLWRESEVWPPPSEPRSLYLHPGGGLAGSTPDATASSSSYTFDPDEPTPSFGGPHLVFTEAMVDNAALEERADTLVFTTAPLEAPLELAGTARAEIWFSSDRPTADVFVRLNRVDRRGRSVNVTDGITRVTGEDGAGPGPVSVELVPTALRLDKGEALRVVVASGAHPRYAANLGLGSVAEQMTTTEGFPAHQVVYHDAVRTSKIELPVWVEAGAGE